MKNCRVALLVLIAGCAVAQVTLAQQASSQDVPNQSTTQVMADAAASPEGDAEASDVVEPTTEERLAMGRELIAAVLKAHGGEAFTSQESQISHGDGLLRPFGQAVTTDLTSLVVIKDFPRRDRIEMTTSQGLILQVFDGDEGWVSNQGQVSDQTARLQNRRNFGYDVLRRFDDSFEAKQIEDQEIDEENLAVVRLADEAGNATFVFIHPETHRVVQVGYTLDGVHLIERYSGYQEISGVQVPFRIDLYQGKAKVLEFEVQSAEVNVEIADDLFVKP